METGNPPEVSCDGDDPARSGPSFRLPSFPSPNGLAALEAALDVQLLSIAGPI